MKKLMIMIAIVLGMGTMAFAQEISDETYEEAGLFGKGPGIFHKFQEEPLFPEHAMEDDVDASGPLGSGIAVLVSLGAAYAVARKRREE